MNNQEIYEGLQLIVQMYISEAKQKELISLLNIQEAEGGFPSGKGILAYVDSDSNGIGLA